MGDRFKKVQSGQDLQISAEVWNNLIDITRRERGRAHNVDESQHDVFKQADIFLVKNVTGVNLPRFAIVDVGQPIISPSANELEFKNQPTFQAITPTTSTEGRLGILLEPIASQAIGRAVVAGVTVARVAISGTVYDWAEPVVGNAQSLRSVPHGPVRVLWMESVGTIRWAIVRIEQSNLEEIVFITSNRPGTDGFYPGFVQHWNPQTGTWSNRYACKVLDANR